MRYFKAKDIQQMSDTQLMSFKVALQSFDCQGVDCADCVFCSYDASSEVIRCVYGEIEFEQQRRAAFYEQRRKHYLFDV